VNKKISKNCFYCKAEPIQKCSWVGYDNDFVYNGIDRVDNSKGYEINNCVPCCIICNKSKLDLSLEEWKEWIEKLYQNFVNAS
jgi:hypothetical protein